jgi:hypothetical protein
MEEPNNTIKFRLVSITNEKTTPLQEGYDVSSVTEESLQFQYKIWTTIKLAENTITVIPSIRYIVGESVLFASSAEFNYSVLSLETAMDIDRDNKKLNMKVDIFPALLGSAYSTLRGIVYARTLSTPLEKYPLPIIDVSARLSKNGISIDE